MLFFGISLAAQRWSSTAWIRSFPKSLCSTTTSRWCRGSSFACTTSTTTPTTWLMTTSWGRSNARWARWASLIHDFGSSRSLFFYCFEMSARFCVSRLSPAGRWLDRCCWRTRGRQVEAPSRWVESCLIYASHRSGKIRFFNEIQIIVVFLEFDLTGQMECFHNLLDLPSDKKPDQKHLQRQINYSLQTGCFGSTVFPSDGHRSVLLPCILLF